MNDLHHINIQSTGQNSHSVRTLRGYRYAMFRFNSRVPLVRSSSETAVGCGERPGGGTAGAPSAPPPLEMSARVPGGTCQGPASPGGWRGAQGACGCGRVLFDGQCGGLSRRSSPLLTPRLPQPDRAPRDDPRLDHRPRDLPSALNPLCPVTGGPFHRPFRDRTWAG